MSSGISLGSDRAYRGFEERTHNRSMSHPEACAWLVLPTYNEAGNIEAIVEAARANMPAARRILIVDDDSPDGTGWIADGLSARHDDVVVMHRAVKGGLGTAYIAGFRRALAGGADLVLEMDSDFSHDPADLPRLIEAAESPIWRSAHATSQVATSPTGAWRGEPSAAAGASTRGPSSASASVT